MSRKGARNGIQNPTRKPALPVTVLLKSVIASYLAEANMETCLAVRHSTPIFAFVR